MRATLGRSAFVSARGIGRWLMVATIVVALPRMAVFTSQAGAQVNKQTSAPAAARLTYTEHGGTFGDGTRYLMRVPSKWNGTLIRDLDYVTGVSLHRNYYFLEHGYAVAGTARHDRRWVGFYDPVREVGHLNTVLDIFEERFRKPDRVVQYGCSGGGHLALAIAEDFSDRVDGVIATAAHTPIWLMNTWMDKWFVLKALLAPDLPIVNLPSTPGARPEYPAFTFAWRQAINTAQQTPEGRARIALAIAVGQIPDWVTPGEPIPDRNDVAALQRSMYQTLLDSADRIGGVSRFMFENPAGFRSSAQPSWNTGVDYKNFFNNGSEFMKRAVRQLYQQAGLDLQADLERVNAFPRISADPRQLKHWSVPGRTVKGNPKVPVLRMHAIGDHQVPVSLVQGYADLIRANGKDELFRTAFVAAPTHCDFTVAESAAMLATMMQRLDTGRWGSTAPEQLNALARSLDGASTPRFIAVDQYKQGKYNRAWIPD